MSTFNYPSNEGLVLEYRSFQVEKAKILRTRYDITNHIEKEDGINFLEIGTGSGDFADHIASSIKVNNLTIADTFEGYDDYLKRHGPLPEDQESFVFDRLKDKVNLRLIRGNSRKTLGELYQSDPYTKYDFIYIDADHAFDNVMNDIFWSTMLLAPDGIIGIDDYCFKPPGSPEIDHYDVQQAVSAFLNENHLWRVKYFSFNGNGFQNIFIYRHYNDN